MAKIYAYLGNWESPDQTEDRGISVCEYDGTNGTLRIIQENTHPQISCGSTCLDAENGILYCVNERKQLTNGEPGGEVYALKADPQTGLLTELGRRSSYGLLPSYCAFDQGRGFLIVTNHSGRSFIVKSVRDADGRFRLVREYDETGLVLYTLEPDGSVGEACDIVKHTGRGALEGQANPHAHSIRRSPDGRFYFVCDKGNDSVYMYAIDEKNRRLIQTDRLSGRPGSSPRYCVFHPTKPIVYYNNETMSHISVVGYDGDGRLTHLMDVSCLENGEIRPGGASSDICITRDGRFLCDLVRENNTAVLYELDAETGMPVWKQSYPCEGVEGCRGGNYDPDERFFHIATFPGTKVLTIRVAEDGTFGESFEQEVGTTVGNITFYSI